MLAKIEDLNAATALLLGWKSASLKPHGDLHPRNILLDKGGVTGIIDLGNLTAGDSGAKRKIILFETKSRSEQHNL
jgi:aminoglycoside phosphotransferase (APT) family kinase protein